MAAHRYWRARQFAVYDGVLIFALSEFQLYAGTTRVDGLATLTASTPPISGAVADLKDGSTSTVCALPISCILQWDFAGSPQDVTDVRLGSGPTQGPFLLSFFVEWSDDGSAWTALYDDGFPGVAWPGASSLTVTAPRYLVGDYMVNKDWSDGVLSDGTTYSTGSVSYGLSSGRLALGVSGTDAKVRFNSHVEAADVDVTVVLTPAGGEVGIVLRTSSWANPNDTYAYGIFLNSTNLALARGSNGPTGAYTSMTAVPHGINVGVPNTLRVRWVGQNYFIWINGALKLTGTDTTFLGVGEVGLRVYNSTGYYQSLVARKVVLQDSLALNLIGGAVSVPDGPVIPFGVQSPPGGSIDFMGVPRARPNYLFAPDARGRISGTVKLQRKSDPPNSPVPVRRRVRLIRDRDGLLVGETWSDAATGAYEFLWIEEREAYTVLAYDYEHNDRAVVADNLTPELMV